MADPADLIEQALHTEGAMFDDNGIEVVRDYGDIASVSRAPDQLLNALRPLIRNAVVSLLDPRVQHARVLRISLSVIELSTGPRLRIELIDNGVGIASQHMAGLFNDPHTADSNRSIKGLRESYRAIQTLNGTLTVASAGEDRGAMFVLELPVLRPE